MMFAGGGLFLSMVATTMWMSNDVSRMREEARAKEAQRCAMAQQASASNPTPTSTTTPATDFSTVPAAAPEADTGCDDASGATTDGQPTPDGGMIDPDAGGPPPQAADGQFTDPSLAAVDPTTGQPITTGDPGVSATAPTQPVDGDPGAVSTGEIAEAGF